MEKKGKCETGAEYEPKQPEQKFEKVLLYIYISSHVVLQ
jgi:hypothetical protein